MSTTPQRTLVLCSVVIAYVINPGSGGLKLACATLEPGDNPALPGQLRVDLTRAELPLAQVPRVEDLPGLVADILALSAAWPAPDAIVGRGGVIGRVPAGTYRVTPELAQYAVRAAEADAETAQVVNLGAPLALGVAQALEAAQERSVPAFIVDPQSVDELLPAAQETGVRGLRRSAQFHALNARVTARRAAYEVGKRFTDARVVVAHLGATTSVTAFEAGRAIDSSGSGPDGGPMGARQSGPLPTRCLLTLLRQHGPEETLRRLASESGFLALTGSADLKELEARSDDEDVRAATAAFVQQACKAVGEQVGALSGRPDAIVVTGGIARWDDLMDQIERRLGWMAPVLIIPGELELEALAEGAGRVLLGLEPARDWKVPAAPAGGCSGT